MNTNIKLTERLAIMATLDPASQAAGTVSTAWVPMTNVMNIMALIQTGVLGTSGTLDAKLRQATDASGTGAKDVPGKAITQIVKASGDNVQALIEATVNDLDVTNGFGFVALSITVGTAASIVAAALIGGNSRYMPVGPISNQAAVKQVI